MSACIKNLLLAIDQGASKTLALIADENGHLLGVGKGRGACWSTSGMDSALQGVQEALDGLSAQVNFHPSDIGFVAAGMSGIDWPGDDKIVQDALAAFLALAPQNILAVNDCLIALRAGTSSPAGAVLCAGTGLNCAVKNETGEAFVFGYYIRDDCQGGSALGLRAVQAAIDMEAGLLEETGLKEAVLEKLNCETAHELLRKRVEGRLSHSAVCALPLALEALALSGDEAAGDLLYQFGMDMADYAAAGLKKLDMLNRRAEIVLSGSLFKCQAPALTAGVKDRLREKAPLAFARQSKLEPVVGGILLSLDAQGRQAPETLEREAEKLRLIRKN